MNKFKKKESILKRFYYKRKRLLCRKFHRNFHRKRHSYYRKITIIKANRLSIRITCHSCRVHMWQKNIRTVSDLYLDIKGYKPVGSMCAMCREYMRGGLHD